VSECLDGRRTDGGGGGMVQSHKEIQESLNNNHPTLAVNPEVREVSQ
jgi:hypothetical protein